ncbi:MAG: response regulator transcription factor, partial [Chitinophagaceae bacterium]
MSQYRVIIIDDERLAREEIKQHLLDYPDLAIAAEAADADDAERQITQLQPDLVFLDIQMPERSGLQLLESLEHVPEVIFTTAYDQYAVKAFELNALDYLVKPIRRERFAQAMEKARSRLSAKPTAKMERTFFIKEGDRYHFVKAKDVALVESAGNYARLFVDGKKLYLKRSLNQLEKNLDPGIFFRISRTEIININYIKQVLQQPKGKLTVLLQTGES